MMTLPVSGGRATAITHGLPYDTQPTFSPDGHWLAYVSDRSGADNLWIVHPDGSAARQITFGNDDTVLVSPAWSADGQTLTFSRYRPDLNNYELWRTDLAGHGMLLAGRVGDVRCREQRRVDLLLKRGANVHAKKITPKHTDNHEHGSQDGMSRNDQTYGKKEHFSNFVCE